MPLPKGFNSNFANEDPGVNHSDYLLIIGKLNYVSFGTRPDIAYAVNCLARFSSRPSPKHWKVLNHLVCYLAGTKDRRLKINPSRTDIRPVECFTNANWGGPNAQSTPRVLICLYGCHIMWVSRRLVTVASSTCQAKYMALGNATQHLLWIRNLLQYVLGVTFTVHVFCNNQSAVKIACKDASNKRTQTGILCLQPSPPPRQDPAQLDTRKGPVSQLSDQGAR